MDILFRKENKELFAEHWRSFVADNNLGPENLLENIDYLLAYSENLESDQSFVATKNNQPVACVFLPIEKNSEYKSISIANSFMPAPIFINQKNLEQDIMNKIDQIAKENNVAKIMFRIDPLERQHYSYNYLLNYDYLNVSLVGYVVDCQNIDLRRNHQRAVKKIEEDPDYAIYIMDKYNSDYQIHGTYRKLHHKCAGRVTRPKETYDLQFKMLEQGTAVLVGLKYKRAFIAFTYYTFSADKASSFSAADDPDFDHLPLYHIINKKALEYLKKLGIREMDMGQPLNTSGQLFYSPDQKQKNIALFKTGFNGHFVNNFQGVKYFSKKLFQKEIKNFYKNYQVSGYE
ncbi:MAG: GNAT family N-acetyltransferase [Candidatus Kuenenbacteria bacterium]